MKTKEEILSMFFERVTEYKVRESALLSEYKADELHCLNKSSLFMKIVYEIRLLADILGEDVPEEHRELVEKI